MSEKVLKLDEDYTLHLESDKTGPVKDTIFNVTSLGPFLRISQNKEKTNIIYILAYFDNVIEKRHFKVTEIIGKKTIRRNDVDSYEVKIDVLTKNSTSSIKQNLWRFIVKASVDLSQEQLVLCSIDYNEKQNTNDKIGNVKNIEKIKDITIGDPRRGTKVIIAKIAD